MFLRTHFFLCIMMVTASLHAGDNVNYVVWVGTGKNVLRSGDYSYRKGYFTDPETRQTHVGTVALWAPGVFKVNGCAYKHIFVTERSIWLMLHQKSNGAPVNSELLKQKFLGQEGFEKNKKFYMQTENHKTWWEEVVKSDPQHNIDHYAQNFSRLRFRFFFWYARARTICLTFVRIFMVHRIRLRFLLLLSCVAPFVSSAGLRAGDGIGMLICVEDKAGVLYDSNDKEYKIDNVVKETGQKEVWRIHGNNRPTTKEKHPTLKTIVEIGWLYVCFCAEQ